MGIFWNSRRKLRKQVRKGGGGREQVKKRNLNFSHIGSLNLVGKFKPRQIMSNESANFWHVGFLVLILGLINAVYSSKSDFRYLLLIRKYSVRECEKRHLEDMKKVAEGRGIFSWGMAIILSRKRWTRWKKKQEGVLGVKINVREIALN